MFTEGLMTVELLTNALLTKTQIKEEHTHSKSY